MMVVLKVALKDVNLVVTMAGQMALQMVDSKAEKTDKQ